MKERLGIIKLIVLVMVFFGALTLSFTGQQAEAGEEMYTTFEATKIPVLYMKTEQGQLINPAHGHTLDVGARRIFNGITPLYSDRTVDVALYNYGAIVKSISYQVRDIETDQLLEDTVVKTTESKDDFVNATLNIKNLIAKDKEYLLTITVSTDKHESIKYYERIIWTDGLKLDEKLDFVLTFNGYTYNKKQLTNIGQWIETSDEGDNTNLGHVNIFSTRAQIGWASLTPRIEGNVTPVIWEVTPGWAQISLQYRAVTTTSSTESEAYSVKDFYRVYQTKDKIYLMDYDREAEQIFDAYNDLQASGRINLGIKSELGNVEAKADASGKFSYFVQNGNLWCYSRSENKFTNVFSFDSASEYAGREMDSNHAIKIISVDTEGNAWFSLCGYMNGGNHDGQMGLSLFSYNYAENIVREIVFIPVNVPYNIMIKNVGDVSYVNDDVYYVKINQYLYSINLVSGEFMVVTDGLFDGTYAVNGSGTKIAYHDSRTKDSNKTIRIFDFQAESEKVITGANYGSGKNSDYLKIIGYIGDDLVYGMADEAEVSDGLSQHLFPMYTMVILSDEYFMMKKYSDSGSFVYEAEIDGMRVNLWRVARNETGLFEEINIDQIISKTENEVQSNVYTEIVTTSKRQKELYLNIPVSSADTETVTVRPAKEIQFLEQPSYAFETDYYFANGYMLYGRGEWQGAENSLKKAISRAAGFSGMIMDFSGNYVWKKTEGNTPVTWDPEKIQFDLSVYSYDLTGISLENALYYTSIGKVVAGMYTEGKYVYIHDYNKNDIIYYDPELERDVTVSRETANKRFIQCGNKFLVLE